MNLKEHKEQIIISLLVIIALFSFALVTRKPKNNDKVSWLNEQVYYTTNLVLDTERNKALSTNSTQVYVIAVATTNKVNPLYFRLSNSVVELGVRDDGVIVSRKANLQ